MAHLQQMAEVQSRQQGIMDQTLTLIGQLAEAHLRTEQKLQEFIENTNRRFSELAESQQHTDERLNALIKIVDDLIRRDGHRGRPQ